MLHSPVFWPKLLLNSAKRSCSSSHAMVRRVRRALRRRRGRRYTFLVLLAHSAETILNQDNFAISYTKEARAMRCARKFANVFLRQTCANWAVAVFKVPLLYRDWPIVGDPCRMWIGCESSSTELLALCIWSILRSGTHYTAYSCSASCLRPSGNCRIATRCAQKRTAAVHTRRTVFKSLYCPGGRRQRLLLQLRECEKSIAEFRSLQGLRLTCLSCTLCQCVVLMPDACQVWPWVWRCEAEACVSKRFVRCVQSQKSSPQRDL